jgi:hypothetical protein
MNGKAPPLGWRFSQKIEFKFGFHRQEPMLITKPKLRILPVIA